MNNELGYSQHDDTSGSHGDEYENDCLLESGSSLHFIQQKN